MSGGGGVLQMGCAGGDCLVGEAKMVLEAAEGGGPEEVEEEDGGRGRRPHAARGRWARARRGDDGDGGRHSEICLYTV